MQFLDFYVEELNECILVFKRIHSIQCTMNLWWKNIFLCILSEESLKYMLLQVQ